MKYYYFRLTDTAGQGSAGYMSEEMAKTVFESMRNKGSAVINGKKVDNMDVRFIVKKKGEKPVVTFVPYRLASTPDKIREAFPGAEVSTASVDEERLKKSFPDVKDGKYFKSGELPEREQGDGVTQMLRSAGRSAAWGLLDKKDDDEILRRSDSMASKAGQVLGPAVRDIGLGLITKGVGGALRLGTAWRALLEGGVQAATGYGDAGIPGAIAGGVLGAGSELLPAALLKKGGGLTPAEVPYIRSTKKMQDMVPKDETGRVVNFAAKEGFGLDDPMALRREAQKTTAGFVDDVQRSRALSGKAREMLDGASYRGMPTYSDLGEQLMQFRTAVPGSGGTKSGMVAGQKMSDDIAGGLAEKLKRANASLRDIEDPYDVLMAVQDPMTPKAAQGIIDTVRNATGFSKDQAAAIGVDRAIANKYGRMIRDRVMKKLRPPMEKAVPGYGELMGKSAKLTKRAQDIGPMLGVKPQSEWFDAGKEMPLRIQKKFSGKEGSAIKEMTDRAAREFAQQPTLPPTAASDVTAKIAKTYGSDLPMEAKRKVAERYMKEGPKSLSDAVNVGGDTARAAMFASRNLGPVAGAGAFAAQMKNKVWQVAKKKRQYDAIKKYHDPQLLKRTGTMMADREKRFPELAQEAVNLSRKIGASEQVVKHTLFMKKDADYRRKVMAAAEDLKKEQPQQMDGKTVKASVGTPQ